jgi:hypothetical protein
MKKTLIAPAVVDETRRGMQGRVFQLPPLALTTVAAATPKNIDVEIADEAPEPINFSFRKEIGTTQES